MLNKAGRVLGSGATFVAFHTRITLKTDQRHTRLLVR
ncbi:Uncharacterised protein [Vibrio cholerae]|nr:Uncharacterised protein [Vibrio cholerae]